MTLTVQMTKPGLDREWRWGGGIFLLALLLRLGWVALSWGRDGAALPWDDERLHWQLARNLVTQGALVSDDGRHAARLPLYPAYLGIFATVGESGVLAARGGQALLGALTALLVWRWARDALGRWAGRLSGVLVAVDPFGVFFANLLLTEVLFALLLVLLAERAWRTTLGARRALASAAAFGAVAALAALTRPEAIFLLPVLWLGIAAFSAARGAALRAIGVSTLLSALVLTPWALRNQQVLGAPVWLSTNGGVTLYDGQGPQARGGSDQSFLREMPQLAALGERERDRALQEAALRQMSADPARVAWLAWVKLRRTWSLFPNVEEYRSGAAAWAGAAYSALLMALALIGAARALRPDRAPARATVVLAAGPILGVTLLACVFVGSVRYRVPLMPLLAVCGGAALGTSRPGASRAAACAGEPE